MMIVDAIDTAPSQHAVHFLVTAYMESLRHFERTCGVPPRVLELPVCDTRDLAERLEALHIVRDAPCNSGVVVSEVHAVLTAAIVRLDELGEPGERREGPSAPAAPAMHAVRNGSPRSSLSV